MNDTPDLKYTQYSYGDHELQRLGVWRWKGPSESQHTGPAAHKPKYWLM